MGLIQSKNGAMLKYIDFIKDLEFEAVVESGKFPVPKR